MAEDLAALFDRIDALLDAAPGSPARDSLARIESTLTDGYAQALVLEGERWRIERKIGELARTIRDVEEARELHRLAERLTSAEEELVRLRGMLVTLRDRAETVRLESVGPAA